ncbi:MAG: transcription antitermination factor NusB [Armatimonadetes bacterium]|nr:transcription antitermination factor NusB [Armatimonadota bacterium]
MIPETIALPVPFNSTPPALRRVVRETSLRVLYALDAGKRGQEQTDVLTESAEAAQLTETGSDYVSRLVASVQDNRAAIDAALDKHATDFPTHRQAVVDRNILRLAAAEIAFGASDAPAGAVVNEAVELAKKYSTKDSGRFVNGVLGAFVRSQDETFEPQTEPEMDEILPPLPQKYWGDAPITTDETTEESHA